MAEATEKLWVVGKRPNREAILKLSKEINVNLFLSEILVQRNINDFKLAKDFFRPSTEQLFDPFLMKDMDVAVNRLSKAINERQNILVYGDYDVDGTCSVALVYSFLFSLSENIQYYIPDRYNEGYGISKEGIDFASKNEVSLVISLDCGIRAVDQVKYAKSKGIDFIICDHHLPPSILPGAIAILDPKRVDCKYPFKELCGCGVGFKLLQAYCSYHTIEFEKLSRYLDYVAIATASDIVPLIGENRVFAALGLEKINSNPLVGVKSIIEVSGFKNKLTIGNIVFGVGPRINAAGRLKHAHYAVELLTENDPKLAEEKALEINDNNLDRRDLDKKITHEALEMIADDQSYASKKSIVLFKEDWHKGIIGIVASRCIETYYKPTIILTESKGKAVGSARSVDGFDVYQAINACKDLLIQYGGHKYAAGLTLSLDKVEEFKTRFDEAVSASITEDQLIPKVKIDIEVMLEFITERFYRIIDQMSPFGPENMTPVFLAKSVEVVGQSRLLKEEHIKFCVRQETSPIFDCIGFGMKEYFDILEEHTKIDICFTVDLNEWKGRKSIQLMIKDIRRSDTNESS